MRPTASPLRAWCSRSFARNAMRARSLGRLASVRRSSGRGCRAFHRVQRAAEVVLAEFGIQRGERLLPEQRDGGVGEGERAERDQHDREQARGAPAQPASGRSEKDSPRREAVRWGDVVVNGISDMAGRLDAPHMAAQLPDTNRTGRTQLPERLSSQGRLGSAERPRAGVGARARESLSRCRVIRSPARGAEPVAVAAIIAPATRQPSARLHSSAPERRRRGRRRGAAPPSTRPRRGRGRADGRRRPRAVRAEAGRAPRGRALRPGAGAAPARRSRRSRCSAGISSSALNGSIVHTRRRPRAARAASQARRLRSSGERSAPAAAASAGHVSQASTSASTTATTALVAEPSSAPRSPSAPGGGGDGAQRVRADRRTARTARTGGRRRGSRASSARPARGGGAGARARRRRPAAARAAARPRAAAPPMRAAVWRCMSTPVCRECGDVGGGVERVDGAQHAATETFQAFGRDGLTRRRVPVRRWPGRARPGSPSALSGPCSPAAKGNAR